MTVLSVRHLREILARFHPDATVRILQDDAPLDTEAVHVYESPDCPVVIISDTAIDGMEPVKP